MRDGERHLAVGDMERGAVSDRVRDHPYTNRSHGLDNILNNNIKTSFLESLKKLL